jgi:ankyrin repeat protein
MLVENGANVNIHPMHQILDLFNGVTPLMYAATGNDKLSFYYLLEHGADPNAKSKDGRTVLMFLEQGQWDCADMTQALINHGAKVSEKAPDGTDALFYAMKKGNTESVAILKKYLNLTNQK